MILSFPVQQSLCSGFSNGTIGWYFCPIGTNLIANGTIGKEIGADGKNDIDNFHLK